MADLSVAPKVSNDVIESPVPAVEPNHSGVKNVSAKEKRDDIVAPDLTKVDGKPLKDKEVKQEGFGDKVKDFIGGLLPHKKDKEAKAKEEDDSNIIGKVVHTVEDAVHGIFDRDDDGDIDLDDVKVVINDAKGFLKVIAGLASKVEENPAAIAKLFEVFDKVDNAILGDAFTAEQLADLAQKATEAAAKIVALNEKVNGPKVVEEVEDKQEVVVEAAV